MKRAKDAWVTPETLAVEVDSVRVDSTESPYIIDESDNESLASALPPHEARARTAIKEFRKKVAARIRAERMRAATESHGGENSQWDSLNQLEPPPYMPTNVHLLDKREAMKRLEVRRLWSEMGRSKVVERQQRTRERELEQRRVGDGGRDISRGWDSNVGSVKQVERELPVKDVDEDWNWRDLPPPAPSPSPPRAPPIPHVRDFAHVGLGPAQGVSVNVSPTTGSFFPGGTADVQVVRSPSPSSCRNPVPVPSLHPQPTSPLPSSFPVQSHTENRSSAFQPQPSPIRSFPTTTTVHSLRVFEGGGTHYQSGAAAAARERREREKQRERRDGGDEYTRLTKRVVGQAAALLPDVVAVNASKGRARGRPIGTARRDSVLMPVPETDAAPARRGPISQVPFSHPGSAGTSPLSSPRRLVTGLVEVTQEQREQLKPPPIPTPFASIARARARAARTEAAAMTLHPPPLPTRAVSSPKMFKTKVPRHQPPRQLAPRPVVPSSLVLLRERVDPDALVVVRKEVPGSHRADGVGGSARRRRTTYPGDAEGEAQDHEEDDFIGVVRVTCNGGGAPGTQYRPGRIIPPTAPLPTALRNVSHEATAHVTMEPSTPNNIPSSWFVVPGVGHVSEPQLSPAREGASSEGTLSVGALGVGCSKDLHVTLDLHLLSAVVPDPTNNVVHVQGGARLGQLGKVCLLHGIATVAGTNPESGFAGYTVGGGYGYLSRQKGMTVDNLIEVEAVDASGDIEFTFRTYKINTCTTGLIVHLPAHARALLELVQSTMADGPRPLATSVLLTFAPPPGVAPEDGSNIIVHPVGGAIGDLSSDSTAFPWRLKAGFWILIISRASTDAEFALARTWTIETDN
ncbi:hypothetical protein HDU93_009330 [Gonapodya sp. JEL0774]|nr:hypothetical protein HDU93_009330 [Gonapodya sp. JEL0774]